MPQAPAAPAAPPAIPRLPAPTGELAALRRDILRCTRCPLHAHRRRACPGEGPARAAVMIVGEAPGWQEDRDGRPFVGAAGQLLTRLLADCGIDRGSVYITNTVKCLPPMAGASAAPSADAVQTCLPFLRRELELVSPAVVVLAGGTPLRALVDPRLSITRAHGRAFFKDGRWLYPIYHPSYLLRSRGDPRVAAEARDDLQRLHHLRGLHAATLRRPWPLPEVLRHLFASTPTPHEPNRHSQAAAWHVLEHFALPTTRDGAITWDVRGLRPMFKTPSAIQELLRRWAGRPVRLRSVSEAHGAVAALGEPDAGPAERAPRRDTSTTPD